MEPIGQAQIIDIGSLENKGRRYCRDGWFTGKLSHTHRDYEQVAVLGKEKCPGIIQYIDPAAPVANHFLVAATRVNQPKPTVENELAQAKYTFSRET